MEVGGPPFPTYMDEDMINQIRKDVIEVVDFFEGFIDGFFS